MAMRVGELARRTGVGVSTLRAWERRFHLLEPQRSPAGHRLYDEADVERVDAVVRLVGEGLTLPAAIARVAAVGSGARPDGEGEALLYGQILQAANDGVWVSRNGRTRYVNRRMAEIMRSSVEELLAIPVLEFFEPEMLPTIRERTAQVRAGHRLHFTVNLRRADGSSFLADIDTTPLFNQAGRYEGSVSIVTDITHRHDAEVQARLRATLLEAVEEAVVATEPDGTVVYANAATERLFRRRAADVIGTNGCDLFGTPDDVKERTRATLVRAGQRHRRTATMVRHDGSTFVADLVATPTVDDDDRLVGFAVVIRERT